MREDQALPTGKSVMRRYDNEGRLTQETHAYGLLDIAIQMEFTASEKTGEMYFAKKRLVSRARYEKVRAEYPDMPPADPALDDFGGELAKAAQSERRQLAKAAKTREADPEQAAQLDAFARSLLDDGKSADAMEWTLSPANTLGEMTPKKSRNLVEKLVRLGTQRIHACQIDACDEGEENSGVLVVELPDGAKERKALLREIAKLAGAQGLQGDFDDGQRLAVVKLD